MQITMSPSTILRSCIHYNDSYIYTSTGVRVELFRFEMRSAQCEVVFPILLLFLSQKLNFTPSVWLLGEFCKRLRGYFWAVLDLLVI